MEEKEGIEKNVNFFFVIVRRKVVDTGRSQRQAKQRYKDKWGGGGRVRERVEKASGLCSVPSVCC